LNPQAPLRLYSATTASIRGFALPSHFTTGREEPFDRLAARRSSNSIAKVKLFPFHIRFTSALRQRPTSAGHLRHCTAPRKLQRFSVKTATIITVETTAMFNDEGANSNQDLRLREEVKAELAVEVKDQLTSEQCGLVWYMFNHCTTQQLVDLWYANVLHGSFQNSALLQEELERSVSAKQSPTNDDSRSVKLDDKQVEKDDDNESVEFNRCWLRTFDPETVLIFVDALKPKYHPRNDVVFAAWLRHELPRYRWPKWLAVGINELEMRPRPKKRTPEPIVKVDQGKIMQSERTLKRRKCDYCSEESQ
ncbi:hypothetical protein IWX92DRAFT_429736, partial [Phyllosticta citricarpa]